MAKKSFKNAISDKTKLGDKTGVAAVFSATTPKEVTPVTPKKKEVVQIESVPEELQDLRQSFIIREDYFEKLKDFVHFKKMNVDFTYNQKTALQDALDLLFDTVKDIPPRPEAVRRQENKRMKNLRKARNI